MPYMHVKKDDKYCVHKKGEDGEPMGESLGCHDTKEEAEEQMAALYAAEEDKEDKEKKSVKVENLTERIRKVAYAFYEHTKDASSYTWVSEVYDEYVIACFEGNKTQYFQIPYVMENESIVFAEESDWQSVEMKMEWVEQKSLGIALMPKQPDNKHAIKALGQNRIGGYGILWGDEGNRDLHNEYFSPDTKDLTAIFDTVGVIPFIVHHAADDAVQKFVVGAVDVMEKDTKGLWWEAKILEHEAYREYVEPLLKKDALFSSSGTLPSAKRAKSGHITRWPIAEMTGTWMPAEYRMLEVPLSEIKSAYKSIGVDFTYGDAQNEDESQKGVEKARLQLAIEQELNKLLKMKVGEK